MTTPKDLFSRALKPLQKPAPESEVTQAPPVVRDTIAKREYHPDGSITLYRFDPVAGEQTRWLSPEEARLETQPLTSPTPGIEAHIREPGDD